MVKKKVSSLMRIYRIMRTAYLKRIPILPGFLMRLIRILYSCDLPYKCNLGKGVILKHNGLGVVIHPAAIIGDGTMIYQNVSIAGRNNRGTSVIGKNVFIGAGACILGGVSIGDNVVIGANAVVITDLPDGAVAVGVPAIIKKINQNI